jgi:SAM-dependent methyltransferase
MSDFDRNEAAAKHFDDRARAWTDLYLPDNEQASPFLRRRASVEWQLDQTVEEGSCERALDLGCGTGPYLPLLSRFATEVVGIDIAPAMLEEARQNLPADATHIILKTGSATAIPFPDDHFDLGVCVGVLEYFDDPIQVLTEVFRVMRPLGQITFTVPNLIGMGNVSGLPRTVTLMAPPRWKISVGAFLDRLRGREPDPSRYYLGASFTRARLRRLARQVGFEVVKLTCTGYQFRRPLGIKLPSRMTASSETYCHQRRHRFPWKYFGDDLVITLRKPGA